AQSFVSAVVAKFGLGGFHAKPPRDCSATPSAGDLPGPSREERSSRQGVPPAFHAKLSSVSTGGSGGEPVRSVRRWSSFAATVATWAGAYVIKPHRYSTITRQVHVRELYAHCAQPCG